MSIRKKQRVKWILIKGLELMICSCQFFFKAFRCQLVPKEAHSRYLLASSIGDQLGKSSHVCKNLRTVILSEISQSKRMFYLPFSCQKSIIIFWGELREVLGNFPRKWEEYIMQISNWRIKEILLFRKSYWSNRMYLLL